MIKNSDFFIKFINPLIIISIIFGIGITVFGFYKLSWPQAIIWTDKNAFLKYIGFLSIATFTISLLTWRFQRNTAMAVLFAMILLSVVTGAIWPFLVTVWFAIASSLLGYWLLLKFKIGTQNWVNNLLVGAGVYGTATGLLAHYAVNYPGVYGVALALPLVFGWRVVLDCGKSYLTSKYQANIPRTSINWVEVAIGVIALFYMVVALMPELGADALAVHLFIPGHMALRHQWGFDARTYVWAVMPALGNWVFTVGYMLAGETAARLINVGFIFILCFLLRSMVLWAGGTAVGARWAVLIFLSTPLTFAEGSSLYIESIWASFVIAGVMAALKACTNVSTSRSELPMAGFMLGSALAAKAVTFTILPALLLVLLWRCQTWYKTAKLPIILLGLGFFIAIGIIPYATAGWLTGNPVFPLFNKIFQSPFYLATENFNNPSYRSGFTWDILYKVTFKSEKYLEAYAGASGFQWLFLFIAGAISLLVSGQRRAMVLLAVSILSIAIAFHSQSYLRYIFPSIIILIACIGVALSRAFSSVASMRLCWMTVTMLTVGMNLFFINAGNAFYQDFPLKSIFDKSKREQYLLTRFPIRNAVELVNKLNIDKSPVAVFSEPYASGLSGDELYPGWYNISFQKEIAGVKSIKDIVSILNAREVSFIILDAKWNGVNCCGDGIKKQALLEEATEKIIDYGPISIRKVKKQYLFKHELLINTEFKTLNGWIFNKDINYNINTGIVKASVDSSTYQVVAVKGNTPYINNVEARCGTSPTTGRVQVNWMNSKNQFISASIKTFECSADWMEQSMEVISPEQASSAAVYVSGHNTTSLEFKSNSLRQ